MNSALARHEGVPVRGHWRSLPAPRAVPLDRDIVRELALARDTVVLTVGAHAIAFATYAGEPSSKNRRWALAWRSRSGDSGGEIL